MNKQLVSGIAIGIIIAILLTGAYILYNIEKEKSYNEAYTYGYTEGALIVSQTGSIPYIDNSTGVPEIKTISVNDVCTGYVSGEQDE